MKGNKAAESDFDANVIWEEVRRAAARAPKWASTDPPYPVINASVRTLGSEKQIGSVAPSEPRTAIGPDYLSAPPERSSFWQWLARKWRG